MLSAAKEKKEKKAIRHRGVGAPNKGMSRNGGRDSMGLIGPGKTMLRSGPLQGSGAPTSVRTEGLPSMGFLATFGARRFPKGNEGKRVSSGYNRRRRLATGRSGKQQAERTAVRTAPIVCPEESPLVCPQAHTPCSARRVRPEGGAGGERKATLLAATGDNFAARIPPGGA